MQPGTILVAINPCVLTGSGRKTLTVGREYKVMGVRGNEIFIIDDTGINHYYDLRGKYCYLKWLIIKEQYSIY